MQANDIEPALTQAVVLRVKIRMLDRTTQAEQARFEGSCEVVAFERVLNSEYARYDDASWTGGKLSVQAKI